jgi:polyisoprenoid-binding protein YceI
MNITKKFKNLGLLGILSLVSMVDLVQAEVAWKVSPARTKVSFKVNHFVLMEVEGKFRDPEGQLTAKNDTDFSGASLEARIPVTTIDTGNEDRDSHLKQAVFFDAAKYPEMKFKSKSIIKKSDTDYVMEGSLTIKDITLPVSFKVESMGETVSKNGVVRSKFIAKGTVDRYKYGLKWNELTEAGAMVVGENVDIEMDVTLEKMPSTLASK